MSNVMMKSMSDIVVYATACLLGAVCVFVLIGVLNTPEVQFSNTTGECVKVINFTADEVYSCDNMPAKYSRVWVK